jgi:hypothetical protein
VVLLVEAVEQRHLLGAEREIEDRSVLDDPPALRRFRNGDEALLQGPAQEHLRRSSPCFACDDSQAPIVELHAFGERAIGDDSNLTRVAEGNGVTLLAPWVKFDLVHCRRNLGAAEELLEMVDHKVAQADCAAATFAEDALQRAPGVQTAVGHGPMEEDKVDLVQSESAVARIKGANASS